MALKLKLIAENPDNLENFEIIEEQNNLKGQSTLYVAGPMIGCNQRNKNGRYYDFNSTRSEVNRYIEEMVKPDYNNWEGKDEYIHRFMAVVENKFS